MSYIENLFDVKKKAGKIGKYHYARIMAIRCWVTCSAIFIPDTLFMDE